MRLLFALILLALPCPGQTAPQLALQGERWERAHVAANRQAETRRIVGRILASRGRYEAVDAKSGVPWYVVAALHNMESGGSFRHHLHEGSPLSGRTRWVPKGRPLRGSPPFTWEMSAMDALAYDRMANDPPRVDWASLSKTLYQCERYNGTGYLRYRPQTPSPYLWAGTTIERPGKYVADGKWSSTARSSQIGVAAIFKEMEGRGVVKLQRLRK